MNTPDEDADGHGHDSSANDREANDREAIDWEANDWEANDREAIDWEAIDWDRLARLRTRFLEDVARPRARADYWSGEEDLAAYDAVFAARIGWKWDAVFDELRDRRVRIDGATTVLDYGCGTGIATRRLLRRTSTPPQTVLLHDRSAGAMEFAERRVNDLDLDVQIRRCPVVPREVRVDILLVSHVLGELSPRSERELLDVVARSDLVVWVEPGSREVSRRLGAIRDGSLETFDVLAPCTHAQPCHALTAGDRDWCHFFATPPGVVFTDARWVEVGKRLGIDLRSLPYSCLVLRAKSSDTPAQPDTDLARIIGRPQVRAKLARYFACDAESLHQVSVFKNRSPEIYKRLKTRGVRHP